MRNMQRSCGALAVSLVLALGLGSCKGGGEDTTGTAPAPASAGPDGCYGQCADASSFLSVSDVQTIIAQAVAEAKARSAPATIVVTDRLGNVLAAYRMAGAPRTQLVSSKPAGYTGTLIQAGLDSLEIPAELGAISKALTAVYFSSEGNAFTSRTAGQVVQEHFNPGDATAPAGPLFGVQISNLPCSDINAPFNGTGPSPGPHPAPVGLAADPGGVSLYKTGVPVGAIGVAADGIYGLDADAFDRDFNLDEDIAIAGSFNYAGPLDRRADRITAGGRTLRYANVEFKDLASNPATAPAFASLTIADGALIAVPGYATAAVQAGTAFGQPASGVRADAGESYDPALDAYVVVNQANVNRFPPRAGTENSDALTAQEVKTIAEEAFKVAQRTRAQVRRPLGSPAGETIVITDSNGVVLAIVRTRDALVDAIDVTTQKARTAAFFSNAAAAGDLAAAIPKPVKYFSAAYNFQLNRVVLTQPTQADLDAPGYLAATRNFLGLPNAFGDGAVAFSSRALGLLTRPLYPDGVPDTAPAPLAAPNGKWSLFNTGLQLDLIYNQLALRIAGYLGNTGLTVDTSASQVPPLLGNCTGLARLPNGFTEFPGGVPIYRNGVLVGGIGASGDGSDQSDLVAFLGLANAGKVLNNGVGNAPSASRADNYTPLGTRLSYTRCPQAPFNDSNVQNACEGL